MHSLLYHAVLRLCSKWQSIPYKVHYFGPQAYGPWSKERYSKGKRLPFSTQPEDQSTELCRFNIVGHQPGCFNCQKYREQNKLPVAFDLLKKNMRPGNLYMAIFGIKDSVSRILAPSDL